MVFALTWLPAVLEAAGLKVAEVPEWRTRGRGEMGTVRGIICHHTAGRPTGNMPSLNLLVTGRPDLPGPLAHLGLGRDGTFYVIAAGRCNHAGAGKWRGVATGNSSFIGIEAENVGTDRDPWPEVQMEAYRRGSAAILAHIGTDSSMVCGHREFALPAGRKTDPRFEMAAFRERVAAIMTGRAAPAALIPARDGLARTTLRRGDHGELVRTIQAALGLSPADGVFGAGTESAVRAFQRTLGAPGTVVADGIVGPKTWAALDARGSAPPAKPAAPAAPATAARPAAALASPAGARGAALPPADGAHGSVRVEGLKAIGPDGRVFATALRKGFVTYGDTRVSAWLKADPGGGAGIAPGAVAVVAAISANEGKLEAVNSWDDCHLSFGIFQWTAGANDDPGELPGLLATVKADDPAGFAECFGRFGLDCRAAPGGGTMLALDGHPLAKAADKAVLRQANWAYRFWRAGHHPAVRRAELGYAVKRIDRFADTALHGHPLRAWLSSQLGMAMLLDQHVNRPGHVPKTLRDALDAVLAGGHAGADPAGWRHDDELRLLHDYLELRAATSMTDSQKRAQSLFDAARQGLISDARGSFGRA